MAKKRGPSFPYIPQVWSVLNARSSLYKKVQHFICHSPLKEGSVISAIEDRWVLSQQPVRTDLFSDLSQNSLVKEDE